MNTNLIRMVNCFKGRYMKNEILYFKDDIPYTCPDCGKSDDYTVYLNIDSVSCHYCGKEHEVALYASNVELKAI